MFKRAVISDEISQDLARAVAVARQYHLDGIELRSVWDKNPHELNDAEIQKVKTMVAGAGLQVPCIAAPIFKCELEDDTEYQEHIDILKRTVYVARELGATLIRGFTFWERGGFEAALPQIVSKIAGIEPILKNNGMKLAIEYDPATYANSSQRLERVLTAVASDSIGALYDPGNSIYIQTAERPFPEGYERLRPYIVHIHIKDVLLNPETREAEACRLGDGLVGFPSLFQQLARDGYAGWLSLETHYRKRGPLSEDLLALPKGSAFSLGGEEASAESLGVWNEIWAKEGFMP